MKKLLLFLIISLSILLISCGPSKAEMEAKNKISPFKPGVFAYLKIDSAKVLIVRNIHQCCGRNDAYEVRDLQHNLLEIEECELFTNLPENENP